MIRFRCSHLASRALVAVCTMVCLSLVALPAEADDAERAAELFEEGREAVRVGDFARGCPLMAASQALVPSIGALFNLAVCDEHDGALLDARKRWQRAIQLGKELADDRQTLAEERLRELEARIPTVDVVIARGAQVSKPPSGAIAELDGTLLAARALEGSIEMDPGPHRIAVRLAGQQPVSVGFEVAAGDHITVSVPVAEPAPAPAPAPPPLAAKEQDAAGGDDGDGVRMVGFVLLGAGAASLIVSAVTGGMYLGERSTVDGHCDETLLCDQEGLDAASSADTLGTINGVTFVGGLFAATAGAALILLAPGGTEVQAKPAVGWSSGMLQIEGTW